MSRRSVNEMTQAMSPELDSLRAGNRILASELKGAREALGDIGEVMRSVRDSIVSLPPVRLECRPAKSKNPKAVTLVVQVTDWHIGLVTPGDMVEGFNEYNWGIAQRRVEQLVRALRKYIEVHRNGYTIEDVVVLCTGDYVSGDIHEGLIRTNEFQAPVQAVRAGRLLAWMVQEFSRFFGRVTVEFIAPGNHDRLTRKPQAQAGGENSWGYVVGCLAQDLLSRQGNVIFHLYTSMQEVVTVAGARRYLCGHGDGIIGTWGIPFYGIERKKMREATARMNMPKEHRFHRIVIGHFHTGLDHMDWLLGGSLSGTDENDHKQGRHAAAHQTAWLVHPEHGEFAFTRWFLD